MMSTSDALPMAKARRFSLAVVRTLTILRWSLVRDLQNFEPKRSGAEDVYALGQDLPRIRAFVVRFSRLAPASRRLRERESKVWHALDIPRDAQRAFIPEQEEKEIGAVLRRQALQERIHRD